MVTYKVELTEKELKNLARDRAIAGRFWKVMLTLWFPLLAPLFLGIVLRDWLKVLSTPVQLIFVVVFFLPWVIVVLLQNRAITRRTQACLAELKKQGK